MRPRVNLMGLQMATKKLQHTAPTKPSSSLDDLRLLSREDLCNAPEVTEAQAAVNKLTGKGPRKPRPANKGLLDVSEATFDRWVYTGRFPRGLKIGARAVRWRARDVRAWIDAQQATATAA